MAMIDHDLLSVQEARVVLENAKEAQYELSFLEQDDLDQAVELMLDAFFAHSEELAGLSAEETGYGNVQDKIVKNRMLCHCLRRSLKDMKCVGILREDMEMGVLDIGIPIGVVVAFCPSSNPTSTTLCQTIMAIKSGNAVVFSPHPKAANSIRRTLDILRESISGTALPKNSISYVHTIDKKGTAELMTNKLSDFLLLSGVPGLLEMSKQSGKRMIDCNPGCSVVFVEKTADVLQAARDIITSKSFDYGTLSCCEQSLVVDKQVSDAMKEALKQNGAWFATEEEYEKLKNLYHMFRDNGLSQLANRSAAELAKRAGFVVNPDTKVLIVEQKYIRHEEVTDHWEHSTILTYCIEDGWQDACEKCIEILLSKKVNQALVIHSHDEEIIRLFACKKPVEKVLVNTPAAFGAMGVTTNFFPTLLSAEGKTCAGTRSTNISPLDLVFIRKVGYGVRSVEESLSPYCESQIPEREMAAHTVENMVKKVLLQMDEMRKK